MLCNSLACGRRQSLWPRYLLAFLAWTHASATSQFIPLPLSAFDHIRPVARSVMVPSPLSWKSFLP